MHKSMSLKYELWQNLVTGWGEGGAEYDYHHAIVNDIHLAPGREVP